MILVFEPLMRVVGLRSVSFETTDERRLCLSESKSSNGKSKTIGLEIRMSVVWPSSETTGIAEGEKVGGAGPLPGAVGEQGVAVLPQEKVSLPTGDAEAAGVQLHAFLAKADPEVVRQISRELAAGG